MRRTENILNSHCGSKLQLISQVLRLNVSIQELQAAFDWPSPQGGAKHQQRAAVPLWSCAVFVRPCSQMVPKRQKIEVNGDKKLCRMMPEKTRQITLLKNTFTGNIHETFIPERQLRHTKDDIHTRCIKLWLMSRCSMMNALWVDWPGQQKDRGAFTAVRRTHGWQRRGMKQSDRQCRYGWLVSKSKPPGRLSAGTDDTAAAGQDAIIASLVAVQASSITVATTKTLSRPVP